MKRGKSSDTSLRSATPMVFSTTRAAALTPLSTIPWPPDPCSTMMARSHTASTTRVRSSRVTAEPCSTMALLHNLSQANKLSRTYAVLLDALNRYRGKEGQQKVTVEHCRCACRRAGGGRHGREPGRGSTGNQRINPVQNKLPMHLSRRCGVRTRNGSPCRSAAMPNGRCRMHGGMSPGAPKGNTNAFKHGCRGAGSEGGRACRSEGFHAQRVAAQAAIGARAHLT
jgi:hypothetical protein